MARLPFIAERFGEKALVRLYGAMSGQHGLAPATHWGVTISELAEAWRDYSRRELGEGAGVPLR